MLSPTSQHSFRGNYFQKWKYYRKDWLFATSCNRESVWIPSLLCVPRTARPRCAVQDLPGCKKLQLSTGWPWYCFNPCPVSPFWESIHPCVGFLIFWIILPRPHSFGLSLHTLSQVDAHLMSGLKAVSCQELNVFCWVLTAVYHQWSRICPSLPFHWDRHHLFLQVCSVYVGYSFCFQISSASTYRIKTKMKMLAGNSESINAARWSGEPALTASLLEAPTLFQRVTEATCRALSDTLLAVNCLKATLGSRAQFHNSVNWWLKENDTCYKTKFFTRWKMTMFPEFLEFPYMAKISVC